MRHLLIKLHLFLRQRCDVDAQRCAAHRLSGSHLCLAATLQPVRAPAATSSAAVGPLVLAFLLQRAHRRHPRCRRRLPHGSWCEAGGGRCRQPRAVGHAGCGAAAARGGQAGQRQPWHHSKRLGSWARPARRCTPQALQRAGMAEGRAPAKAAAAVTLQQTYRRSRNSLFLVGREASALTGSVLLCDMPPHDTFFPCPSRVLTRPVGFQRLM